MPVSGALRKALFNRHETLYAPPVIRDSDRGQSWLPIAIPTSANSTDPRLPLPSMFY